ncbi:MAG: manganese efflux pump [Bacillota bacterium]|nr:manganese efflux pump [Bacillota bacterium]
MSIIEIILLGVGLAMDAVAVSIANGMIYKDITKAGYVSMPVMFGFFQMMMPVAGYYAGEIFGQVLKDHSGLVVLIILGIIGAKMILEGLKKLNAGKDGNDEHAEDGKKLSFTVVLLQAVATSIDAFAVGVGLSAAGVRLWSTVSIIGIVTAIMVVLALFVGKKLGQILGKYSEIAGGAILIIIGLKSFFA